MNGMKSVFEVENEQRYSYLDANRPTTKTVNEQNERHKKTKKNRREFYKYHTHSQAHRMM